MISIVDKSADVSILQGLAPIINMQTRVVILGSFPGVASLTAEQYYAHPRNHFWPLLSAVLQQDLVSLPYAERLTILLQHGVGIWDVYAACERKGSADHAIHHAQENSLAMLVQWAPHLRATACNGGRAWRVVSSMQPCGLPAHCLPSSSAANARHTFAHKLEIWQTVLQPYLGN